jgi:transposase
MVSVEVKSPEQQSVMVLHRTRLMLMRQRIQLSNAVCGFCEPVDVVPKRDVRGGREQWLRVPRDDALAAHSEVNAQR